MLIEVKVIPNAKKNRVLEDDEKFKAYVTAPAVDGKANKALIDLLAKHFKVKKSKVQIIKGTRSREKVVEIDTSTGHLEP
ncbi:MAG: DUF167 domain-containing protein [Candidatus Hydrothermarchaeales archaeon]